MSVKITLKEVYEYSKIDLHIFTFDINKFDTVELSHNSHPNLLLVEALTMSCSIPGIIMPVIMDGCCFIDGGVLCNFPINQCLRDHNVEDEIFGINYICNDSKTTVTQDTTLLEYTIAITLNATLFITSSNKTSTIKNCILYEVDKQPLELDNMKKTIKSQEFRKELFEQGRELGKKFLDARK